MKTLAMEKVQTYEDSTMELSRIPSNSNSGDSEGLTDILEDKMVEGAKNLDGETILNKHENLDLIDICNAPISELKQIRKEKLYRCSECGKSFDRRYALKQHSTVHTGYRRYQCSECGKSFSRKYSLNEHIKLHKGDRCFPCPDCGKLYVNQSQLTSHQKIHYKSRLHFCAECGKGFKFKQDLKKHLLIHTGEKDYVCLVCEKRFSRNGNLKQHMLSHSGEKPFKCTECDMSFTRSYHLKRHIGKHSDNSWQFKCQDCGKCFSEKGYLELHFRKHTGERPFNCPICDKSFVSKKNMKKHQQLHENGKFKTIKSKRKTVVKDKVTCQICDLVFANKNLLYIHKIMVHESKVPILTEHETGNIFSNKVSEGMEKIEVLDNELPDDSKATDSIVLNVENAVYIKEEMFTRTEDVD